MEIVRDPALIWTATTPRQPFAGLTDAGSVSLPVVVNRYGDVVLLRGVVRADSRDAVNRGTVTERVANAVWPSRRRRLGNLGIRLIAQKFHNLVHDSFGVFDGRRIRRVGTIP